MDHFQDNFLTFDAKDMQFWKGETKLINVDNATIFGKKSFSFNYKKFEK